MRHKMTPGVHVHARRAASIVGLIQADDGADVDQAEAGPTFAFLDPLVDGQRARKALFAQPPPRSGAANSTACLAT